MTDARVALVTGGNRGLGLEIVRQLAQKGLKTVLASRDAVKGRTAAEQLAGAGVQTAIVALDVNDQASIDTAVAEIVRLNGRLDVLVNNAGISLDGSRATVAGVLEVSPDIARQTYETNVLGPMRLIQAVAPHMRAQRYGDRQHVVADGAALRHGRALAWLPHVEGGAQCADLGRGGRAWER